MRWIISITNSSTATHWKWFNSCKISVSCTSGTLPFFSKQKTKRKMNVVKVLRETDYHEFNSRLARGTRLPPSPLLSCFHLHSNLSLLCFQITTFLKDSCTRPTQLCWNEWDETLMHSISHQYKSPHIHLFFVWGMRTEKIRNWFRFSFVLLASTKVWIWVWVRVQ